MKISVDYEGRLYGNGVPSHQYTVKLSRSDNRISIELSFAPSVRGQWGAGYTPSRASVSGAHLDMNLTEARAIAKAIIGLDGASGDLTTVLASTGTGLKPCGREKKGRRRSI